MNIPELGRPGDREATERDISDLLCRYIMIGENSPKYYEKARELLEGVKTTFSEYDRWDRILNVYEDVKSVSKELRIRKLVLENSFEKNSYSARK